MLGVERFGGVLRGGVPHRVVPPQIATVGPADVDPGAVHHQNMLHRGLATDCLVYGGLQRDRTPAAVLAVCGDHQFGLGILDPGPQCRGRIPAEHHRVHDAQARAGQHRHDGLGDHRHVNDHPVTGDQAQIGQGVGGLADLVLEFGVGDGAFIAHRFALPVDGDPVAIAGLHMAVDTVVGDVELAADEPLRHRCARPVEHLGEGRLPRQPVCLFGPEGQPVGVGPVVDLGGRVRRARECLRRRVQGRNIGVRLSHSCEPSVIVVSVVTTYIHGGATSRRSPDGSCGAANGRPTSAQRSRRHVTDRRY